MGLGSGKIFRSGKPPLAADHFTDVIMYNPETWKFCLTCGTSLSVLPQTKRIKPHTCDLGKFHKVFIDFETLDLYHESDIEPYYRHIPKEHQALSKMITHNNLKSLHFDPQNNTVFYYQNSHLMVFDS